MNKSANIISAWLGDRRSRNTQSPATTSLLDPELQATQRKATELRDSREKREDDRRAYARTGRYGAVAPHSRRDSRPQRNERVYGTNHRRKVKLHEDRDRATTRLQGSITSDPGSTARPQHAGQALDSSRHASNADDHHYWGQIQDGATLHNNTPGSKLETLICGVVRKRLLKA